MARSTQILRRLNQAPPVQETSYNQPAHRPEMERTEDETDHDRFRRKQQRLAAQDTSSSLPIKVVEKQAAKPQPGTRFEGPLEVLAAKYKDPREVMRHMTVGQYMRYELRGGQIWENGKLAYDGTQFLTE
ncbi:MAG TPA: hypothetical protein PLE60_09390 [Candidatus Latescibacteria bacterium]|nr:hypothetical protein [Candidatus Latescibacterota bacterium]